MRLLQQLSQPLVASQIVSHLLSCRVSGQFVEVVRILHKRMDVDKQFPNKE